jgi:hypothetical protein
MLRAAERECEALHGELRAERQRSWEAWAEVARLRDDPDSAFDALDTAMSRIVPLEHVRDMLRAELHAERGRAWRAWEWADAEDAAADRLRAQLAEARADHERLSGAARACIEALPVSPTPAEPAACAKCAAEAAFLARLTPDPTTEPEEPAAVEPVAAAPARGRRYPCLTEPARGSAKEYPNRQQGSWPKAHGYWCDDLEIDGDEESRPPCAECMRKLGASEQERNPGDLCFLCLGTKRVRVALRYGSSAGDCPACAPVEPATVEVTLAPDIVRAACAAQAAELPLSDEELGAVTWQAHDGQQCGKVHMRLPPSVVLGLLARLAASEALPASPSAPAPCAEREKCKADLAQLATVEPGFWADAHKAAAEVATWPWWKSGKGAPYDELPAFGEEPAAADPAQRPVARLVEDTPGPTTEPLSVDTLNLLFAPDLDEPSEPAAPTTAFRKIT